MMSHAATTEPSMSPTQWAAGFTPLRTAKPRCSLKATTSNIPTACLWKAARLSLQAGGKPEADFTTKVPGRLFSLDLKTKKKTLITPEPFGNIDGIESDGQGGYIV